MNAVLRRICLALLLVACMAPAGAAITVTYGAAGQTAGLGSTTLSLQPPAGTQAGDVLIAQVATPGTNVSFFSAPAGWTLVSSASDITSGSIQQRIYYLTLSGAAATSYDWTIWDWANQSSGVIYAVRGAQAPDCGAASTSKCAGSKQSGGGNTIVAPNVQSQPPTYPAGSLRMAFFTDSNGSTSITPGTSNGETLGRYNRAGSGPTGIGIHGSYFLLPSDSNGGSSTAALSNNQSNVGSTFVLAAGTSSLNHVRLEITGTPLTCTPATVTVKACTDASCSTLSGSAATVTLSASSGTWGTNPLTFTGSTTSTLRQTTVATVTLGASSSPSASNATQCYLNGVQVANCQIGFVDSGLLLTIPTQTAGLTSSGATRFSVAAVKKSDSSLACTPAFASVTRTVDFWANYTSPASGTKTLAVNGTTVAMNAVSVGSSTTSTGTAVSLTFDATGTASNLTLNYADAGQLTLNARYDGSAGSSDASLVMTGSTAFVTVPYALCVDSPDANWGCTAVDTTCTKFTSAGTAFNLRVTGKAYQAATATCSLPTTPNYVQSGLVLSSALVAPGGGVNATLSPSSLSIASGGTVTQATQTVSEVGVFTITATPPASAYFGQTVVPGVSTNSGRFVPAGFTLSNASINDRSDINTGTAIGAAETCASSFTYLGESLRSLFTLTAVNAGGVKTQNYTGTFARLSLAPVASAGTNGLAFGAQNGATLLNSRLTATCASCGSFASGAANQAVDLTIQRSPGSSVDGPYTPTYGLVATDPDGVGMQSPNFSWDLVGASDGLSLGSSSLYFGRMRVENAYGSPLLSLRVPTYAQIWNGTTFAKNAADNCTRLTVPSSVSMASTTTATLYCSGGVGLYGSLSGVSASFNGTAAAGTATLVAGDAVVLLSKPTNSGGGYLDFAPSVPDYLKYNVDGVDQTLPGCTTPGDSYLHDDNPRARIRFGARRNDSIIYSREVY